MLCTNHYLYHGAKPYFIDSKDASFLYLFLKLGCFSHLALSYNCCQPAVSHDIVDTFGKTRKVPTPMPFRFKEKMNRVDSTLQDCLKD